MTLNIVMPLAGKGQRFKDAGYKDPKPLIDVCGTPMAELVRLNATPNRDHRFIHIAVRCDIPSSSPMVLHLGQETEGAACTVVAAQEFIDNYDPLLIVNGDQYIDGLDMEDFLTFASRYHGCIMTFPVGPNEPPKWSYVQREKYIVGKPNLVKRVAEKEPISREATCGLYWFRHGRDFLRAAHAMITQDIRVNGEFYVAPVYNQLVGEFYTVGAYDVGEGRMWGLGTPEDLERFIQHGPLAKGTAA